MRVPSSPGCAIALCHSRCCTTLAVLSVACVGGGFRPCTPASARLTCSGLTASPPLVLRAERRVRSLHSRSLSHAALRASWLHLNRNRALQQALDGGLLRL